MAKTIKLVSKNLEGKEVTVLVQKPNHTQMTDAQFYAATVFKKARESGMILRNTLDAWLEDQGLWTQKDKDEVQELEKAITDNLKTLKSGKNTDGGKLKLSEGRALAVEVSKSRFKLQLLQAKRQSYDEFTVEGAVDNARFDYLVSFCVLDEEGKQVFSDIDDYFEKKAEPYAAEAAAKLAELTFEVDANWQKKLPENEFLLKYKFIDDDLRFVDKDGKHVTVSGNPVVEKEPEVIEEVIFEDDVYV